MKKTFSLLLVVFLCCALLAGCGGGTASAELSVYSFSGENDQLRLSNGVLVLSEEDVFHGGDLEVLDENVPPAVDYTTEYYLAGDGEERTLLSMQSVDRTGGTLDPSGSTGAISGDLGGRFYDGWQNDLWLELSITDQEGQTFTYQLQLQVTEVTGTEES